MWHYQAETVIFSCCFLCGDSWGVGTAQVGTAGGGSRLPWSVIEVLYHSLLSLTDGSATEVYDP